MRNLEHIFFDSRESLREWMEKNHNKSKGIWMIFFKKHTGIQCISYREALEEALCFGWIDSIIKKVDDKQYIRKFTPRTNISNWSDLNKKIVISLIRNGKMTRAGLEKIDPDLKTVISDRKIKEGTKRSNDQNFQIPDFILKAFARNEPALKNFNNLAKSYRRLYVAWITDAKREDTIMKRLEESIKLLKENKRLGLK